jgi:hypothetical protein
MAGVFPDEMDEYFTERNWSDVRNLVHHTEIMGRSSVGALRDAWARMCKMVTSDLVSISSNVVSPGVNPSRHR